jgi:hypothetical protein
MVAAKSTVAYLQTVLPGQTDAWYQRIAAEITAGRMPLPKVETIPESETTPTPINPARQRFLNSEPKQETSPQVSEPAKPRQVYQHQPQNPLPKVAIPNTPQAVLEQFRKHRPDQKASAATKSKLVRLVQGDRELAARLVSFARAGNPDKTEKWCWEKAIHDLERDRGR